MYFRRRGGFEFISFGQARYRSVTNHLQERSLFMLKILVTLSLLISSWSFANPNDPDHIMTKPGDIKWMASPDFLPAGAQIAILHGDPSAAGLFTIRLKMPDKYKIPPHFHPADENITIISGDLAMAVGHDTSITATVLPSASFALMKAGTHHFVNAIGETIVQVTAMGPFGITYVNPDDDPRNP
jgi:hypothetical protein